MSKITITIPLDTAQELLSLVKASSDTDNLEWDNHMKLIEKKLTEKNI